MDTDKLVVALANAKLSIAPGSERDSANRDELIAFMDEAIGHIKDAQIAIGEDPEGW